MKYLCMVFFDEKKLDALSDDEWRAFEAATRACEQDLRRSGHFIAAQALQSVQVATTLRVRNGRVSVTDGPFAETNEQLGGFSVIETPDMSEVSKCDPRNESGACARQRAPRDRGGDLSERIA
jgi:hypothetical protein